MKAHSKAEGVLFLVPLPKINMLYAMLNNSIVYSPLDCTFGYHHIVLSPEAHKKSTFVMLIGKFKFRKEPFGLVKASTHFQQKSKVFKGIFLGFQIFG